MSFSEKHHSTPVQSSRDSRHIILQRTLAFFYQKKKTMYLTNNMQLFLHHKHKYIFENTALSGVWIFTVVMFVSTSLVECSYPSRMFMFETFWISKGVSMKELICLSIY